MEVDRAVLLRRLRPVEPLARPAPPGHRPHRHVHELAVMAVPGHIRDAPRPDVEGEVPVRDEAAARGEAWFLDPSVEVVARTASVEPRADRDGGFVRLQPAGGRALHVGVAVEHERPHGTLRDPKGTGVDRGGDAVPLPGPQGHVRSTRARRRHGARARLPGPAPGQGAHGRGSSARRARGSSGQTQTSISTSSPSESGGTRAYDPACSACARPGYSPSRLD